MSKETDGGFIPLDTIVKSTKLTFRQIAYLIHTAWVYDIFEIYTTSGERIDKQWIYNKYYDVYIKAMSV